MVRTSALHEKNNLCNLQSLPKLCIRQEAEPSSFGTLKTWLVRLALGAFPLAVIVAGFVAQVWIQQQAGGVVCQLLLSLSFLLESGIIWVWDREYILEELRSRVR